jgi:uncharacterized membrane protein
VALHVAAVSVSEQTLRASVWRQHFAVLIPILIVYFFLAFYHIDHQSLWVDEVITVRHSDPNAAFLAPERWVYGRGPLHFLLLQLWARWDTSEFALRSFSVFLGGITVGLAYMMAFRLCNRRMAWMSTTLLATSPFLIWYSHEVRYVMLTITTALFAMYTFHLALSAKRLSRWLLYCGGLILAFAASVVNIFLPVAQGLYLVCSPSRRPVLWKWAVCQLLVFALFLWWANDGHVWQLGGYWPKLLVQMTTGGEQLPSFEPPSIGGSREFSVMALPYTLFAYSAGFSLGPSVRELHASRFLATLWPHALILSICTLLFGSLFLLGLAALGRQPETAMFLASWLVVPIIGTLGISALIPSIAYNVRYAAMGLPAYFIILSAGTASFRRPIMQLAFLAAVLLINGLSLANYYYNPRYARDDARSAARYLEAEAHAGDIIVGVGNATALQYYYKGSVPLVSWGKTTFNSQAALIDPLQELSKDHEQVWLVEIRPWEADPEGMVKAALDERHQLMGHKELPGVDIYAYRLRQSSTN